MKTRIHSRRRRMMLVGILLASIILSTGIGPEFAAAEYRLEAKLRIPSGTPTPSPTPETQTQRQRPFRVGETLKYSVGWGGITGGYVTISIPDIINYDGHDVYQVLVEAESVGIVAVFYSLEYLLESLIDTEGLFSRRYWTRQHENGDYRERQYRFDQERNTVYHNDTTYYITYGIQDEVSAVYYVRTLDLEVGTPVYLNLYAKRQNWRVKCEVLTTETLKVKAGTFDTIVVEPELNFDGIMKKGKIRAWFTTDEHRIPVQVKSKIAIGAITMELEEYTLGDNRISAAEQTENAD